MKTLLVIAVLAVIHASEARIVPAIRTPKGLYETAPYDVLQRYEGFEERRYPARRWATTSARGPALLPLREPMASKLSAYVEGGNDKNMTIAKTIPITILVEPLPLSDYSFTMGFYLPEEQQQDAPAGGEDIVLEDRPEMTVYTRTFEGYPTDALLFKEAQQLMKDIEAAGITDADYSPAWVAGYKLPFALISRTNEIWYSKLSA